jgi:D-alanyl-D-alanine carboxypeptidase
MNDQLLAKKIKDVINEQESAGLFSGAILVAHNDQPIISMAAGYAIQPDILRNQPNTKFNLASVTKMLTAVAVLKLVEQGKLDLHTLISAYNSDLPHADKITLHQLLTHTAGFDRYWNDAYRSTRSDLRTIGDYLKLFTDEPLLFEPGTQFHYGNTGYVVIGALIEQVSGLSYYEFMKQKIFEPAGMKDTDFYEMDIPISNCAIGYTKERWNEPPDGLLRNNQYIYGVKGSPSEHCFSTTDDLFLFFKKLKGYQLIGKPFVDLCFTSHARDEKPGISYGYGFHIIDDGIHGHVIGHGGRAMGGDTFALMYDLGFTLIILSNYDRPAARAIMNKVADLFIE